jgi:chorismate synthase
MIPDKGMVHGVTQPQTPDPDIESKLKHAVGKAIAKSDTMGAEVSMIVECYPGSISTSNMTKVLVERCAALGMKELYGKWYIQ